LRGPIQSFINAIRKVPGLEFIDEEELKGDDQDDKPTVYLLVPDARALRNLTSLWRRWVKGENLGTGFTPWRDVFAFLRDIRTWGPLDRVRPEDRKIIAEELSLTRGEDRIRLEIELVFRQSEIRAIEVERDLRNAVVLQEGRVISRCRITDIGYHAILVELTIATVNGILQGAGSSIAEIDTVMHIRPQSVATQIETGEAEEIAENMAIEPIAENQSPILALLDGVPVAQHPLLAGMLNVDDQFGLEQFAQVADRHHGTAMASLVMHGDRNRGEIKLARRIHLIPVLGSRDRFPDDRLIIDLIYQAVLSMREGIEPAAASVLIVNLSLGNARRPFHGQMSPWSRLIDRLSYRFGILFVISAGNHNTPFDVPSFLNFSEFESSSADQRAHGSISALGQLVAERRLLSPAESVNGLTVGAANEDAVSAANRRPSSLSIDPFENMKTSNPSSALGPGFANSIKPDILMPGGKEHVSFVASGSILSVRPSVAARAHGLKVAAPPRNGIENIEHFTSGTSAAAALASRTCHQIHDALELAYGDAFLALSHAHRATLLKALIVHTASWPQSASDLIRQVLGPIDNKQHVRQKDNIRRFLGYGIANSDAAVACAEDRATFWASGTLPRDKVITVQVPIPNCVNGQAKLHSLHATLAWFTPVVPGRQSYRSVRLKLNEPNDLSNLRVEPAKAQPDQNQGRRGTVFSRHWEGEKAPVVSEDQVVTLEVQRESDQGQVIDESVPFGLAVTFTMPGVIEIYNEVRARITVAPRVAIS
jgi:hypothetical protein